MLALVVQGRQLLREGRAEPATRILARALARTAARGQANDALAAQAHVLHATAMDALGEHQRALVELAQACANRSHALGPDHSAAQLICIAQARPLGALQRRAKALALLDHALPILRQAMGKDAPRLARLQALRAALANESPGTSADRPRIEAFI